MTLVEGGPAVAMPKRIWVDTDAACGHGATTDPDDCFALLLLARADGTEGLAVRRLHLRRPQHFFRIPESDRRTPATPTQAK